MLPSRLRVPRRSLSVVNYGAGLAEVVTFRGVVLFPDAGDVVGLDPPFSDARVGIRMEVVGISIVGVVGPTDLEWSVISSGVGRRGGEGTDGADEGT